MVRSARLALLAFCVLFTAAAVVELVAQQKAYPADAPLGPDNCPASPHDDYWREQLRYLHIAAVLRFTGLAAAIQAVHLLPRPRQKGLDSTRLAVVLLLALVTVVWQVPFDDLRDLIATAPGVLALLTAFALAAQVTSRWPVAWPLLAGTLPMLVLTFTAMSTMAQAHREIVPPPDDEGSAVLRVCVYAVAGGPPSPVSDAVLSVALAAIVLAVPALFVWAVLRARQGDPAAG